MEKEKLLVEHLLLTFVIMGICWGLCVILGINGITMNDNRWIYLFWFMGGVSPAIASFIVLKKNENVTGFKEWIKRVFDLKQKIVAYLLAVLFPILHAAIMCLISGYRKGLPLYFFPLMVLAMIFAGGLEEAGWRYITFPELDKKLGFVPATLITAVIWWLWHLPLFYILGAGQYHKSFFVFGIMILGLSFILGTIRRLTGSVWLCVLCHAIFNSIGNFFHYDMYGSFLAASITTAIVILVSMVLISGVLCFFVGKRG